MAHSGQKFSNPRPGPVGGALGRKGHRIVDTPDALLVGDIKRSQEVRDLVDELNNKGYGAYTIK
jgi:hypothetical protein